MNFIVTQVKRVFASATLLYALALGMGGLAVLATIALPPVERGGFAATLSAITIGVAVGGFSIDTFFLAQGSDWVRRHAGGRHLAVFLGTVPLAALVSLGFAYFATEASLWVSALGGGFLALANVPAGAALAHGRFTSVYRNRAIIATGIVLTYAVLIAAGQRSAGVWLTCWFTWQAISAASLWIQHPLSWRSRERDLALGRKELTRWGYTHSGVVAQVFTYRFDQIAVSRYQGAEAIAVYSLAVSAIEFTHAAATVAAQRVLGDKADGAAGRFRRHLVKALAFALAIGVAALAGLAVLGLFMPGYDAGLLLGAILLPGSLFVVTSKVLSARLVNQGGERFTAITAAGVSILAVITYLVLVPAFGTVGAAAASTGLYGVHALVTYIFLRRMVRRTTPTEQQGVGELVG